jgi:hypothetical protein
MKTVGDIIDLILSNQKSQDELGHHALHLMDAREAGSTTEIGLDEVPRETPIEEVEHHHVRRGCKCYKFAYDMGGRLGAIPFKDAFAKYGEVSVRTGKHGTELYIVGDSSDVDGRDENTIYVIVGKHTNRKTGEELDAVFTWHPGEPMPTLEDGITNETAVKVDIA